MIFIDIFKEEGLYTFSETSDGVAFRIKYDITNRFLELRIVMYSDAIQINPKEMKDYTINETLVNKDFVKVDEVKNLFGFDRIIFFKDIKRNKNLLLQAKEIVSNNGGCPQKTLGGCVCEECLYPFLNKKTKGCNPQTAYGLAISYVQIFDKKY